MAETWELFDPPDTWLGDEPEKPRFGNRGLGGYQCQCGRFAVLLKAGISYNGTWDIHYTDVLCTRCGEVRVRHT